MWVVKARNFLLEQSKGPLADLKAIEVDMRVDKQCKKSAKFEKSLALTNGLAKTGLNQSKQSLHSTIGATDTQAFEGRRARIAREKATLTTICQMLKSANPKPTKAPVAKTEDGGIGQLCQKRYTISTNRSASFGQRSYEITASYISKKFSKGLFGSLN